MFAWVFRSIFVTSILILNNKTHQFLFFWTQIHQCPCFFLWFESQPQLVGFRLHGPLPKSQQPGPGHVPQATRRQHRAAGAQGKVAGEPRDLRRLEVGAGFVFFLITSCCFLVMNMFHFLWAGNNINQKTWRVWFVFWNMMITTDYHSIHNIWMPNCPTSLKKIITYNYK